MTISENTFEAGKKILMEIDESHAINLETAEKYIRCLYADLLGTEDSLEHSTSEVFESTALTKLKEIFGVFGEAIEFIEHYEECCIKDAFSIAAYRIKQEIDGPDESFLQAVPA